MIHTEALDDDWRLSVGVSDEPMSNGHRLVYTSLSKHFRPPPGYMHGASVTISNFEDHLATCEKAWRSLMRIQEAAQMDLQLSDTIRGLFVWRHGVRMTARGAGKFQTHLTLFTDEPGYLRHRDLILRVRDRAAEIETALRQFST